MWRVFLCPPVLCNKYDSQPVCSNWLLWPGPLLLWWWTNGRLAVKWDWFNTIPWSAVFAQRQPQWAPDPGPVPSTQLLWGFPEPGQAFPLPSSTIGPLPSPWIPIKPVYHATRPIHSPVGRSSRALQSHWTLPNLLIRPLLPFSPPT